MAKKAPGHKQRLANGGTAQTDPKKKPLDYSKAKKAEEGKTKEWYLQNGYSESKDPSGRTIFAKQTFSNDSVPPRKGPPQNPSVKPKTTTGTPVTKRPLPPRSTTPQYSEISGQDIVYFDEPQTPPKSSKVAVNLDVNAKAQEKRTDMGSDYYIVETPNTQTGAGYTQSIKKYYNKNPKLGAVGAEIKYTGDPSSVYDASGNYKPTFTGLNQTSAVNTPTGMGMTNLTSGDVNKNTVNTQLSNSKNNVTTIGNTTSEQAIPGVNTTLPNKDDQGIGTGLMDKNKLPSTTLTGTNTPQLKNGGKVKKAPRFTKKYANGTTEVGVVNPNDPNFQMYSKEDQAALQGQNPNTSQKQGEGMKGIGNGFASMGSWYGMATQASNSARAGVKKDTLVDPTTGQTYSSPSNKTGMVIEETAKPAHETWMDSVQKGDYQGLMRDIFLTPAGGNLIESKGKIQNLQFEKDKKQVAANMDAARSQSRIEDAIRNRNAGNTGYSGQNTTGFAKGGEVKGPGGPKDDKVNAKVQAGSFVVPAEMSPMAKLIKEHVLGKRSENKADLNQKGGVPVKLSSGEYLLSNREKHDIGKKLGEHILGMLAPNAESGNELKNGGYVSPEEKKAREEAASKAKLTGRKKVPGKAPVYSKQVDRSFTEDEKEYPVVPGTTSDYGDPTDPRFKERNPLTKEGAEIFNKTVENGAKEYQGEKKSSRPHPLKGALGNVGSLAEPLGIGLQGTLGYKMINSAGQRPVDKNPILDPALQANIDKARANANFGLSGQESYQYDQDVKNATNDARYSARNFSGGNAGTAFNQERMAINDGIGLGIKKFILDSQLKSDKQRYADALSSQGAAIRMDRQRQLLEDSMNSYNLAQQSGAGLIGTAIRNAIGLTRYNKELEAQEEQNKYSNPSYWSITNK